MAEFWNYMKSKYQNLRFEIYTPVDDFQQFRTRQENPEQWEDLGNIFKTKQLIKPLFGFAGSLAKRSIVGYAMTDFTVDQLRNVFIELSLDRLEDSIDVFYNLLWYINVSGKADGMNLTSEEKSYISGLSIDHLIVLLGANYRGPLDKASLIFAALSGKSAPFPNVDDLQKYEQIKQYPPMGVWSISQELYGITKNDVNDKYEFNIYPPYVLAATMNHELEYVYAYVNYENIYSFAEKYGIIGGRFKSQRRRINNARNMYHYFIRRFKTYGAKLNRPPGLPVTQNIADLTSEKIKKLLAPYTEKEIVEGYEIEQGWRSTQSLYDILARVSNHGNIWFLRNKWCNNDNTMNLFTFETHGEMNKNDNADPVISFGYPGNYRCYQMSELAESFREIDGTFKFFVPDYQQNLIDPSTGEQLIQEFNTDTIKQLKYVLEGAPQELNVAPLLEKINTGLEIIAYGNTILDIRRNEYLTFTPEQKSLVDFYLAWLFFYGMWLRYWKGPGNPYPLNIDKYDDRAIKCTEVDRFQYTYIQQGVYKMIKSACDEYPGLSQWIDSLPICNYDFTGQNEPKVSAGRNTTIKSAIDLVELGQFCMTHASDLFLQTGFYLITVILDKPDLAQFNNFIDGEIPRLLDAEKTLVSHQLANLHGKDDEDIGNLLRILQARNIELNNPVTEQEPFNPEDVRETGHVDPDEGVRYERITYEDLVF